MVTDTLIKKYTQSFDDVLRGELTNDTISLIRKFDSRYKMQINQHFSLKQKYFQSKKFTKNQRLISHLFLEISSAWFCYEILILICKEFDLQNNIILLKEKQNKGNEFRDNFLKASGFKVQSNGIVNKFYDKSILILDKISNKSMKISLLSDIQNTLNSLIASNKKLKKQDYNSSIQDFINEVSEVERIYKANFKKVQKNREDYICKHLEFKYFIGFCYSLRNQYVHNGLTYNLVSSNDKLYVQALQNINDSLNHLVLTLAVAIFKTINRVNLENLS
ncbi:MAG: hypothetical protein PF481_02715 [Bacteroidales bacterium]|jgi:hypothetical protein|nr:hypothetical protein [Bacteroidales bacterium]